MRKNVAPRPLPPVVRPLFALRCIIALGIGAASAAGLGSILGFLAGAL